MSSDDDSGIGSSPLKRVKLRATINSDSESEPTPGCSNWRDETTAAVAKKNVYRRIQFHESDNDTDSEEELGSGHEPTSKRKLRRSSRLKNTTHENDEKTRNVEKEKRKGAKKSSRLRNLSNENDDETEEDQKKEARRSQRNRMSAEKEKRFKSLERLSAKRAGKKLFDDEQRDEAVENDNASATYDDSSELSSCEDQAYYVERAPIVAMYPGKCRLLSCSDRIVVDSTKIIGVWFEDDPSQEKIAWICARHEYLDFEDEAKENAKLDDLERTQSDEEFIDDPEPDEGDTNDANDAMDEITQHLRKETPKDLENADQYLNQLGKYQLEVHSWKNKSLYTSEETRYRRNIRNAKFDEGMKDGSERYDPKLENKLLRTSKKRRKKKRSKR